MLLLYIILHVLRLVTNLLHDLLLVGNPRFLFFDQALLNAFKLLPYRIEVVIMVLDSILPLLVDSAFTLVHTGVICLPLLAEDLGLLIHLAF